MGITDPLMDRAAAVRGLRTSDAMAALQAHAEVLEYRFAAQSAPLAAGDTLSFEGAGTDLARALEETVREARPEAVVLVSDGVYTLGANPVPAARGLGVPVYAIGVGDSADAPLPHTVESLGAILVAGLRTVVPPPTPFRIVGFSFGSVLGGHLAVASGERVLAFVGVGASALGLRRQAIEGLSL